MPEPFRDRVEAGRALAGLIERECTELLAPVVLALPRGGVPVGFEVARSLDAPLDALVVRKLGVPGHEELAMGALATPGVRVFNSAIIRAYKVSRGDIERVEAEEAAELRRRETLYRAGRPFPELRDRDVILVDDGLATGTSMRGAVQVVRQLRPRRLIVGVPVAALPSLQALRAEVDLALAVLTPDPFRAVGNWYRRFEATSDKVVRTLLHRAADRA